ncbi:MAG: hypothetical protein Q8M03_00195 [Legionella sp.]|nr:hypothetical protein [Legionella sp.]
MDLTLLQATESALVEHWQIAPRGTSPYDLNRQLLLEALSERILHLLRHRPEKLLSALYILDIGELVYNRAMEQDSMEDRAWSLAEAVYDRETEKIQLREKYAREYGRGQIGNGDGPDGSG